MAKINQETKTKILQAAEQIFHENGFKGARTTEIAKKAGMSRTMLHYYFRTKEDLFQEVLLNSFGYFLEHAQQLLVSDQGLKAQIDRLVDLLFTVLSEKPGLPSFMVNILNESPELIMDLPLIQEENLPQIFDTLLAKARAEGTIKSELSGENLLLNIYGLCCIPYLTAPLIQFKETRSDAEMKSFMEDRKEMIKTFVWKGIQ